MREEVCCFTVYPLVCSLWCIEHKASLGYLVKQRQLEGEWNLLWTWLRGVYIYADVQYSQQILTSEVGITVSPLFSERLRWHTARHVIPALLEFKSRSFGALAFCLTLALLVSEHVQILTLGSSLVASLLGYTDIKQKSKPANPVSVPPLLIQTGRLYLRKERPCLMQASESQSWLCLRHHT